MCLEEDILWFHGKMTREAAEQLLKEEGRPDGSFLVRESNSSSGDFVLSVLHNDNIVSHFQIQRHTEDVFFSIDGHIKIHGLESLVEHYVNTKGILPDGLSLTVPVPGEAPPHDSRHYGPTNNLLHRATSQGNYTVVSELLKCGYKHQAKNKDGQTAVHLASMKGQDDILRKLIQHGASTNLRDTYGNTPLHYACRNNYPSTVRLLVQFGNANVQSRNSETGEVPLHEAAAKGHVEVIKELLSLNAPANPRDDAGQLPSQLARKMNFIKCATILEEYRSPKPRTDKRHWHHGTLDRTEAINRIKAYSTADGTFLVRYSERNQEVVLTLIYESSFYNYIIKMRDKYLFIDNGPYLDSLEHIIDYYSFMADGLPTVLSNPVPPPPKPPVPESSTIPRKKEKRPEKMSMENIKFTANFANISNNNYYSSDESKSINVPSERIKLGQIIGEGEFGSVHEGTYTRSTGEEMRVAIKTLRDEELGKNREGLLREAQVMMKLDHECIVKFIGLSNDGPLMMLQELVALGSLLKYLLDHKDQIRPSPEFKMWASQIAQGMNYLEKQRFIHRDLAARNILLASRHQAKISDFGFSRALGTDHEYYKAREGGKWPLKWYAPESYNYGNFSHKGDVWGFGVTLWEMYTFGEIPYGEMKGPQVIDFIEQGNRLAQPNLCPDPVFEIMMRCWQFDPENRPTFKELHEFFSATPKYMNVGEVMTEESLDV